MSHADDDLKLSRVEIRSNGPGCNDTAITIDGVEIKGCTKAVLLLAAGEERRLQLEIITSSTLVDVDTCKVLITEKPPELTDNEEQHHLS